MKHIFFTTVITVCLFTVLACSPSGKKGYKAPVEVNFSKDASYALGMNLGSNMKADQVYPDLDEFLRGILDVINEETTRIAIEDAGMIIQEAFNTLREEREAASRQAENDFFEENSKKPGVFVTESGLQYEVITEGGGDMPDIIDTVRVHYEGTLINGTVFDSSYMRGEPAQFPLRGVIQGWAEGLQLMSEGSKYRLFIPSDLGYGPMGAGPQIPPYSTLIFEVELLEIIHDH